MPAVNRPQARTADQVRTEPLDAAPDHPARPEPLVGVELEVLVGGAVTNIDATEDLFKVRPRHPEAPAGTSSSVYSSQSVLRHPAWNIQGVGDLEA